MSILKLKDVGKVYTDTGKKDVILKNINLTFHLGEFVSILGESGVGKSTLMNIIGGLDSKYNGKVLFRNKNLSDFNEQQLDTYRRHDIGFIFQSFHLINHLTVAGNIKVALDMLNLTPKQENKRVDSLLKQVGLSSQKHKYPNQLSGGQQQRTSIARALASDPKILIADEPTGALDQTNTNDVLQILDKIAKQGKLVLTVTHSLKVAKYGTRIVHIVDGTVKQDKKNRKSYSSKDIKSKYKSHPLKSKSLWTMAFDNLKKHKLQNILISLGGAIGLLSILALLGLSTGTKGYVDHQITSKVNPNTVQVLNNNRTKAITSGDIHNISKIKGVKSVHKSTQAMNTQYKYNGHKGKLVKLATDNGTLKSKDIKYGKAPNNKGIIIPQQVAKQINKHHEKDLIGKKINIKAIIPQTLQNSAQSMSKMQQQKPSQADFKITGIMKDKAMVGLTTYKSISNMAKANNQKTITQYVTVNLKGNTKEINRIQNKIKAIKQDGKKEFMVLGTSGSILNTINRYVSIIITILITIAGVALIVAAILMIAILLISVNERTKEIGVLRALGASKGNIRKLFVDQSLLLSLASSIGATILGIVSELGANALSMSKVDYDFIQISPMNIIIIFIISLIIYYLASVLPARKASKLDPIQCLNS